MILNPDVHKIPPYVGAVLSSPSANADRMRELERRWHGIIASAEARGLTDEQIDTLIDELEPIELEIAEAPCDSMDAFTAKLRTVVRNGAVNGQSVMIDSEALIDGMIAFMEGRL